jgi:hypothetical protein
MYSQEKHLDNLLRHKELVKDAAILLGKRLIEQGKVELGKQIIVRGFSHDASKFRGIEWEYLHAGNDVDRDKLQGAILQHQMFNQHHPEFWGGMEFMDQVSVGELCCDWLARAQEFGTDVRTFIKDKANGRFHIDECSQQKKWMEEFLEILLEDAFVRDND